MKQWNNMTLSIIYSNLAKAAEKQQNVAVSGRYAGLSQTYREGTDGLGGLEELGALLRKDLEDAIPAAVAAAEESGDRGALRALRWGEKVAKIEKSLIDRYMKQGDALFDGKDFYICQACGFIYSGSTVPDICPICKAPSSRFSKVA